MRQLFGDGSAVAAAAVVKSSHRVLDSFDREGVETAEYLLPV
jgi:hypothetical protein